MLLPQYSTLVAVAIMAVATPAFADDDYDDDDYRRPAQTQRYIGQHKASQIALKRIGGGTVQEVDLDRDRRGAHYDVEIIKRGYEYKVSIDARNGRVLAAYRD